MHTLKVTCSHYPLSVKHTIEDITILSRPWRKPVRASLPPPGYHPCSVWYPAFRTLILYIVHFVLFILWCCFDLRKSGSLEVYRFWTQFVFLANMPSNYILATENPIVYNLITSPIYYYDSILHADHLSVNTTDINWPALSADIGWSAWLTSAESDVWDRGRTFPSDWLACLLIVMYPGDGGWYPN